jgi:hypothetical protein
MLPVRFWRVARLEPQARSISRHANSLDDTSFACGCFQLPWSTTSVSSCTFLLFRADTANEQNWAALAYSLLIMKIVNLRWAWLVILLPATALLY